MNNHFDKVFVITIPKRKEYVNKVLQDYAIDATIIEGIDKKSPNLVEDASKNKIIVKSPNYNYKPSKIAVHWAHINALKTFLQDPNAQTAVICEDDLLQVNSNEETSQILDQCMRELSGHEWDLLFLERCWDEKSTVFNVTDNIVRTFNSLCRGAYAVTRKCAQILVNVKLTPKMNHEQSAAGDQANRHLIKSGVITALAIEPPIYTQNRGKLASENGNLQNLSTYAPNISVYIYSPYTITLLIFILMFLIICTFKHLSK